MKHLRVEASHVSTGGYQQAIFHNFRAEYLKIFLSYFLKLFAAILKLLKLLKLCKAIECFCDFSIFVPGLSIRPGAH